MSEDNGPAWVYYCQCSHGGLLYIGVANDPVRRAEQHRATQPWWHEVDLITAFLYPSRDVAEDVERAAIRRYAPFYNRAHYPRTRDVDEPDFIDVKLFDGKGLAV